MNQSKKSRLFIIVLLAISLITPAIPIAKADPGWLEGWDKRVKITIDHDDIDAVLTDFPALIYISDSSGINNDDITFIFDEVGANSLKIAVTESDGTTECYVEVEKWDLGNEEGWLWVKVPSISYDADTEIYLYYDNDHADNNAYVGITNSAVAEKVWDSNFKMVHHLSGVNLAGTDDSTSNNQDATAETGDPTYQQVGIIADSVDFDGNDDISIPDNVALEPARITLEVWAKTTSAVQFAGFIDRRTGNTEGYDIDYPAVDGKPRFLIEFGGGLNQEIKSTVAVNDNSWHYIVCWYDETDLKIYIDGIQRGTIAENDNIVYGNHAFFIAGDQVSTHRIVAELDEIRISNIARSIEWIVATYETGRDDLIDFGIEETPPIEPPSDPNLLFGAGFNASSPYAELHWTHVLAGMEQILFGGFADQIDDTDTEYNSLIGGASWETDQNGPSKIISTDGSIKNLRVELTIAPGAGNKFTFTVMLNGNPSALTFDIVDTYTSGSNMVNEIDVSAGDYVSLQCDPTTPDAFPFATWSSVFESDSPDESLILGGSSSTLSNTATEYGQVLCATTWYSGTENNHRQVVPTSGTIDSFYVRLSEDPGTDPDAYRFTLRKTGVSQSLTVTVTADDTLGKDLVNSFDVVAGDILTMMVEPLNVPTATPLANWGMKFTADIPGESIVMGSSSNDLDNTDTEYNRLVAFEAMSWFGTENIRYVQAQPCTVKKLYMMLSTDPGVGNKYDFTLRIDETDSNLVVTVSGTDTTGNSGTLEDILLLDDQIDLQAIPGSTPTIADAYWGFVVFRLPAGTPITIFEVQNSSDGESWTYLGQSTTTNYTDSQVTNGTERYYRVRACNQTGGAWYNSSWTDVNFEKVYFLPGGAPTGVVDDYSIIFLAMGLIMTLSVYFLTNRP